jgi:chlorite dismutase
VVGLFEGRGGIETTQTQTKPRPIAGEKLPTQYINCSFFKLDLLWRRLPEEERRQGKREFLRAVEEHKVAMLLRSFSLTGLRSDADFMVRRISYELDAFEAMQDALMKTCLGKSSRLTEI